MYTGHRETREWSGVPKAIFYTDTIELVWLDVSGENKMDVERWSRNGYPMIGNTVASGSKLR